MSISIDLSGKLTLITGGANGIGQSIAKSFVDAGSDVLIFDINPPDERASLVGYAQERNLKATYYTLDTSKRADVELALSSYFQESAHDAVDILINNVGISIVKPFLELTESDWDSIFNVNVKSLFNCSQLVLPNMLTQGQGCIINIASELAYLGRADFVPYTGSKGAIVSITRSLAKEFAPLIRVNGIAPGPCDTDMLRKEITTAEQWEKEIDLPLGRVATPEEIAMTAVFLASEYASYYCGDILSPNGGSLMR